MIAIELGKTLGCCHILHWRNSAESDKPSGNTNQGGVYRVAGDGGGGGRQLTGMSIAGRPFIKLGYVTHHHHRCQPPSFCLPLLFVLTDVLFFPMVCRWRRIPRDHDIVTRPIWRASHLVLVGDTGVYPVIMSCHAMSTHY